MEAILSIGLGLSLAAACGFRVFVPFLVMSVAGRSGHLTLSQEFEWIASDAALITLAAATACEILAYYVPWFDNFLDTLTTPVAVVAGVVATAASVQGTSELMTWALAVVGGGGAAATVQIGTTMMRGASSLLTAGFGNPVLSTVEAGGALTVSALAVTVPLIALLLVVTLMLVIAIRTLRQRRAAAAAATHGPDPIGG